MSEHVTLDESVQGKHVIDGNGQEVGIISGVRDDAVFVDPDPGLTDELKTTLRWDDVDESDYSLPDSTIDRIRDDEVHLRREF